MLGSFFSFLHDSENLLTRIYPGHRAILIHYYATFLQHLPHLPISTPLDPKSFLGKNFGLRCSFHQEGRGHLNQLESDLRLDFL